ncbi:hypothetical protein R3P38DRAFT_3189097 [Favolaschia claudopus]|uniref:Uncharacterized protein n=1 Tax=Favolaschia claudopus TaxID=2862362 RepID=A0AAW0BTR6_9AGAR
MSAAFGRCHLTSWMDRENSSSAIDDLAFSPPRRETVPRRRRFVQTSSTSLLAPTYVLRACSSPQATRLLGPCPGDDLGNYLSALLSLSSDCLLQVPTPAVTALRRRRPQTYLMAYSCVSRSSASLALIWIHTYEARQLDCRWYYVHLVLSRHAFLSQGRGARRRVDVVVLVKPLIFDSTCLRRLSPAMSSASSPLPAGCRICGIANASRIRLRKRNAIYFDTLSSPPPPPPLEMHVNARGSSFLSISPPPLFSP